MTLEAHSITVGYGALPVLSKVALALEPGRITAIIGPNGCGKSTLMRALGGMLVPVHGTVTLENTPIARWPRKRLARHLALLPQAPVAPDGMSVRRVVEHGRFAHQGFFAGASEEDHDIVRWAIAKVGLTQFAERPFSQLSGGERQRGWIALALAQKPQWLLLDEPTTFLDIGHQFEVLDLLVDLNRNAGLGIVMVLHDINQAAMYADRIVAMQSGAIIADGSPHDVVNADLVRDLFALAVDIIEVGEAAQRRPHCVALPAHLTVRSSGS
jgi:iron complex transport system ATP-binding protein